MSNDFELIGRLLLAAGLRTHMLLTIGPACSRGQHLGDRLGRGAIGAGSYVLGIGGAVLVVGTLFGLRRVSGALQRWGVSREEFVLATVPGFDVQRWEH
jgi:hypothetical protein